MSGQKVVNVEIILFLSIIPNPKVRTKAISADILSVSLVNVTNVLGIPDPNLSKPS